MTKVVGIERTVARPGRKFVDHATISPDGYILGDPTLTSRDRKQSVNQILVKSLDEAADLIERKGFHMRMGNRPEYPSMIQPSKLKIVRS
jgi:hypothetical protein